MGKKNSKQVEYVIVFFKENFGIYRKGDIVVMPKPFAEFVKKSAKVEIV